MNKDRGQTRQYYSTHTHTHTHTHNIYLSSRSGRIISGLMRARLWKAPAASTVPNLLKMAIFREGTRHWTNSLISLSVSLASGFVIQSCSQLFLAFLSLAAEKNKTAKSSPPILKTYSFNRKINLLESSLRKANSFLW